MKEALIQTLHQYFTHPFHEGDEIQYKLPDKIEEWFRKFNGNLKITQHVESLARFVFQQGIESSTSCLNVFTGLICDIFCQSGERKHSVFMTGCSCYYPKLTF